MARRAKVNHDALARILADLLHGPSTRQEMSDVSGLSIKCVRELTFALRKHGVVYRSAWERNAKGAMRVEVFSLGRGRDVPYVKATTADALRAERRRARLSQGARLSGV